jgi:hypothetical protein
MRGTAAASAGRRASFDMKKEFLAVLETAAAGSESVCRVAENRSACTAIIHRDSFGAGSLLTRARSPAYMGIDRTEECLCPLLRC